MRRARGLRTRQTRGRPHLSYGTALPGDVASPETCMFLVTHHLQLARGALPIHAIRPHGSVACYPDAREPPRYPPPAGRTGAVILALPKSAPPSLHTSAAKNHSPRLQHRHPALAYRPPLTLGVQPRQPLLSSMACRHPPDQVTVRRPRHASLPTNPTLKLVHALALLRTPQAQPTPPPPPSGWATMSRTPWDDT